MIYPRVFSPLEALLVITDQAAMFDIAGLGVHVTGAGHHALTTGVTDIVDLDGPDFTFYFWHWSLLYALRLCYRDQLHI
jgi:hypothetical protein